MIRRHEIATEDVCEMLRSNGYDQPRDAMASRICWAAMTAMSFQPAVEQSTLHKN